MAGDQSQGQEPARQKKWWAARSEQGPWEQKEALRARISELEAVLAATAKRAEADPMRAAEAEAFRGQAQTELQAAKNTLAHDSHPAMRRAAHLGSAQAHLDAAQNLMVWLSPLDEVKGLLPGLLTLVEQQFAPNDPQRIEVTELAREVRKAGTLDLRQRAVLAETFSLARRLRQKETLRVRSFVRIVTAVTLGLLITAVVLALAGIKWPHMVPLCFAPSNGGFQVVCPTGSARFAHSPDTQQIAGVAEGQDYLVIELIGVVSAAIAAAATLRRIRGTSLPYDVPVVLALLKLPTGALTAVLGLLLMRGGFIPGLSALDSSAQIIAWAIIFGYAQQLFTKFVDNQGQAVLNAVGGPNRVIRKPADDGKP
ncbi:hypothetical protein ACFW1M_37370 [Streptomyces inhibens]|uniref:hypothetical protein n=1 Tax=Streptomyces inhibens TaxID=2293571 RepID=UPI00369DB083